MHQNRVTAHTVTIAFIDTTYKGGIAVAHKMKYLNKYIALDTF